jgi:hypothetical protein
MFPKILIYTNKILIKLSLLMYNPI